MLVYLNGSFLPNEDAKVPVEDRGFIFGDGVYEVWRAVNGRLFEAERHQARLQRGLRELQIAAPRESALAVVRQIADRLLAENGLSEGEATVYLEITRGAAPRTHAFPATAAAPTIFIATNPLAAIDALRATGASAITHPDQRWLRCDLKTVQLLPNVLAKQKAVAAGATEAVLVRNGVVTEGTHSNMLGVLDGVLRTHPLDNLILPGITRAVVLEIARGLGIPAREEAIPEAAIPQLEELFLASTAGDVTPIVRLDGRPVGDGRPGPIAAALYQELRARLDAVGAMATASA